MHSTRTRTKIALSAAAASGLLLTGGVGAAFAGSLPGAAQDTASEILSTVGIEVPGANEHSAGHPDQRGTSEEHAHETRDDQGATAEDDAAAHGKGSAVSELARETEAQGVDKGAEISGLASAGRSQAGQHGGSDEVAADVPADSGADAQPDDVGAQAPVDVPNGGGTGTADDATGEHADGASTSGTGTADEASSGHSSAGSDNRP